MGVCSKWVCVHVPDIVCIHTSVCMCVFDLSIFRMGGRFRVRELICIIHDCVLVCVWLCLCLRLISFAVLLVMAYSTVCVCARIMGWLRLVGSLILSVSFAEHSLFYRALLQNRPVILRSLLIVATP